MTPARLAIDAAFRQFGTPATFTPATGPPRPVRVLVRRPDAPVPVGEDTTVLSETAVFEVRTGEVTAFRIHECLTVGGIDYVVQAARRLDPDRLVWTVDAYALAADEEPPVVEPPPERFVQGLWDGSYAALPETAVVVGHLIHLTAAGHLARSRADTDDTAAVAGVVVAGAAAGHPAQWTIDHPVERADWSPLTDDGAALLVPGAAYYLSATRAGGLTATPPGSPGAWVVPIGRAVSGTVLHVTAGIPVKL